MNEPVGAQNRGFAADVNTVQHDLIRAYRLRLDLIAGQTKGFDR
jgi:hypothetical protein